jgi:riboflavin kinase/FMN adenylyltransferase
MLLPLDRRIELLQAAGADVVLVEPFTAEFATLSAEEFVEQVLAKDIGARHVVVGADFSFGRDRRGNTSLLAMSSGRHLGIGVSVVPQVTANGLVCSSTKIREFVLEGRVEGASLLLGRPFAIDGVVVRGAGRGRTLGVPTINLAHEGEILPKPGVYAGKARRIDGDPTWFRAAISIGTNPTFTKQGDPELFIEAHLLDFAGDLYDAKMRLAFVAHLREQRRYTDVAELIAAIQADIARTRELCTMTTDHLYETETMAELCARQGRLSEAISIYRGLTENAPDAATRTRAQARLATLESTWQPLREIEVPPADIALPAAPGVAVLVGEDQVTIAWALPDDTSPLALDVLVMQKTHAGIDAQKKLLPVATASGRLGLAVPAGPFVAL